MAVPIEIEVEVGGSELIGHPGGNTGGAARRQTPVAGPCCEVEGMEDNPTVRDGGRWRPCAESSSSREETYGLTHSGAITLNISYSINGLFSRYEEAFGERPEELPDDCSFQQGQHMFFGPRTAGSDRRGATPRSGSCARSGRGRCKPGVDRARRLRLLREPLHGEGEVPVLTEDRFRQGALLRAGRRHPQGPRRATT